MDRSTLRHHARRGGRYERVRQGLYRLRYFPTSGHEHVVAAWLPLREAGAVVSHESALELHELSDVIPAGVHLSLPRAQRGQRARPGFACTRSSERPFRPRSAPCTVCRPQCRSAASWIPSRRAPNPSRSHSPCAKRWSVA